MISTVARHRVGLIILTDDMRALTAWGAASLDDLYVELTPGPMMQSLFLSSRRIGLPPVATSRAHFVQPEEFAVHRLLGRLR